MPAPSLPAISLPLGPARRMIEDAERLRALADFAEGGSIATDHGIALDYYRLADELDRMARDCRDYARIYAGEIAP